MRISRSDGVVTLKLWLFTALLTTMACSLLLVDLFQVAVEPIEPFFPDVAVALGPVGDFLERAGLDPAGPPLRVAPPRDQPGALEHPKVLRHGDQAHVERLGQLGDRAFAGDQTGQ